MNNNNRYQKALYTLILFDMLFIILSTKMILGAYKIECESHKNSKEYSIKTYVSNTAEENVVIVSEVKEETQEETVNQEPVCEPTSRYDSITEEDRYLLAKIVKCEAGNQDDFTKKLVAEVVLNRIQSDSFPDTAYEVIFQEYNGVHQFSPVANGSWEKYEPDESCYAAVDSAYWSEYDDSNGALFFESCSNEDNWHSRNLEFICKSGAIRFYK